MDTIIVGRPVFRAGVNYKLKEGLNARASFGQGFRFPTITELYMRGDIGPVNLYNNPNLKPESGWTSEIGLKKVFKIDNFSGYIDLVGFVMEYNNMMEFTFGKFGPDTDELFGIGFKSLNVGKTRIPGIEFTLNGAGDIGDNLNFNLFGTCFKDKAPVEEIILFSSMSIPGKETTSDPVAITIFFAL